MTAARITTLTEPQLAMLREYLTFLEPRARAFADQLRAVLEGHPTRTIAFQHFSDQRREDGLGPDSTLEHAAVFDGLWAPLEDHVRRLGERFASHGMSFASWFDLITTFRDLLRTEIMRHVREASAAHLVQVQRVANGMNLYFDILLEGVAEGFLNWNCDRLRVTEAQLHQAQKLDAVGRLAGSVAHDFNNVLTVVESYAWLLEDSFDATDPRKADVMEIRRASERAAGITRQLLSISRHSITTPQVVQIDDVVAEFAPMLRKLLGATIELVIHRGEPPPVLIDPGQLEQVLMNLAINARDAMHGTGRVTLETSQVLVDEPDQSPHGGRVGRFAVLSLTDAGIGMDAETRQRIFDPFFTTKAAGKGTGLGLAIVHGIVEQAGGTIEVYSELSRGTTFRVKWPSSEQSPPQRIRNTTPPPLELPPLTVLVVDDQDDVRSVACRIVQQAGCTALPAENAADARRICVSHDGPIHVALLDVLLPDGRGDLLATELRVLRPDLEIVLMSGYPGGALGTDGTAPANLLAKPFSPSQLRAALAAVTTAGAAPQRRSEPTLQPRVLLADDDPSLRRMLVRFLKKTGYLVTEAGTGKEALAALANQRFDIILSDVHMPEGDGLDILRAARRVDLDVPVILISGMPDVETAAKALEYGAFRYLTKPLDLDAVDKLLRHGTRAHALARLRREAVALTGAASGASDRAGLEVRFENALEQMFMVFQPIVRVGTRSLYGVEALMRTREPSITNPEALLEAAVQLDRLPQLGRRVRALSARALTARPDIGALFVNLHPEDVLDIELLDPAAPLTGIAPRVILEITERASLPHSSTVSDRLARARKLGFRIAVDDIGAGYSGLTSFADLTPEIVKIDMSLVRDVHVSMPKQRTIAALCNLCHESGSLVVGEGVETDAEREVLEELGCDLLQGYLIARPSPQLPPP